MHESQCGENIRVFWLFGQLAVSVETHCLIARKAQSKVPDFSFFGHRKVLAGEIYMLRCEP